MKNYTKEEILAVLSDKEKFFTVLKEDNGFFLEIAKNNNLNPDLNLLIESKDVNAYKFLLDNYKLSSEQRKQIIGSDVLFRPLKNNKYYPEESFKVLLNKQEIEKTLFPRLTFEELKEIAESYARIKDDDRKYYHNESVWEVLYNSCKILKSEEFLALPVEFKKDFNQFYDSNNYLLKDPLVKKEFLSIVNKKDIDIRTLYKFSLTKEDEQWVKDVLKENKNRYIEYNELKKIPGFNDIVSDEFLIENFKSSIINSLTKSKILQNKELIQSVMMDSLLIHKNGDKENYKTFIRFEEFKYLHVKDDKIKYILDDEFIFKVFKNLKDFGISLHVGYIHSDEDKEGLDLQKRLRLNYLKFVASELEAPQLEYIDFSAVRDCYKTIVDVIDKFGYQNRSEVLNELFNELNVISTKMIDLLNEEYIDTLGDSELLLFERQNAYLFDDEKNYNKILNPNAFYALAKMMTVSGSKSQLFSELNSLDYENTPDKFRFYENLFTRISDDLIKKEDFKNLKALYVILNHINKDVQYTGIKEIIEILEPHKDKFFGESLKDTNSFFNYSKDTKFDNSNNSLFALLWNYDEDFKFECLNKNKNIPSSFFSYFVSKAEMSEKDFLFIKNWGNKNKDFLLSKDGESYAKNLINSKNFEKFDLNFLSQDDQINFNGFVKCANLIDILYRIKIDIPTTKLINIKNKYNNHSFDDCITEVELFEGRISNNIEPLSVQEQADIYYLRSRLSSIKNGFLNEVSLLFNKEQLSILLEHKEYSKVTLLIEDVRRDNRSSLFGIIADHIKSLDYKTLYEGLENPAFLRFINKMVNIDYNNKEIIKFADFDEEKNKNLFLKIVKAFDSINPYGDEKIYGFKNAPYLFNKSSLSFLKDYMIENHPIHLLKELKYDKNYNYKEKSDLLSNRHTYSKEDLMKISYNLEKQNSFGYLYSLDSYVKLWGDYFDIYISKDNAKSQSNKKIDDLLDVMKKFESNPLLYFTMVSPHFIWQITKGFYDKSLVDEERYNRLINEKLDEKIFVTGFKHYMDILIEKVKTEKDIHQSEKKDFKENINEVTKNITAVYYSLTYPERKGLDKSNYINSFIKDSVNSILIDNAPLLMFQNAVYFDSLMQRIDSGDGVGVDLFKKFFYLDEKLTDAAFNTGNQELIDKYKTVISSIIAKATELKDKDTLSYISYQIEAFNFIKKEMSEDKMYEYVKTNETYIGKDLEIIELISSDKDVKNLLRKSMLLIDLDEKVVKKSVEENYHTTIKKSKI